MKAARYVKLPTMNMNSDPINFNSIELAKSIAASFFERIDIKAFFEGERGIENNSWNPLSINTGYPCLLILFAELERLFPNEGWEKKIHAYVLKIKESIETQPISNISFLDGLTGCCFAIQQASSHGARYSKILQTLNEYILKHLEKTYLITIKNNLRKQIPLRIDLYDLFHGIVGIGVYCLKNFEHPSFRLWASEITEILIRYTLPVVKNGIEYPGWCLDNEEDILNYGFKEIPKKRYFDISLSQGVTGVLAFLAIVHHRGLKISGLRESICRLADWLLHVSIREGERFYWQKEFSVQEISSDDVCEEGWEYGTPGVARVLYLAGTTLGDQALLKNAERAFFSFFEDQSTHLKKDDFSFATGTAGIYLLTKLMARDTHSLLLKEKAELFYSMLAEQMLSVREKVDQQHHYGILKGLSGSLLALMSTTDKSEWYTPFLIDWI
jgi:lantibiotic biosynthesis protein